ncbi:MAG: hypothetical protein FD166_2571 [Bacteroidetes bacterium]|nr:MAG: hypothetical protein FD166_2571 [Bacteroidota bacterium]
MKPVVKVIAYLTIFSIAMGFMESAVVVYLRALYYPDGFVFPLVPLDGKILITELLRELATLIMLIVAGIIAGKNFAQRFVFFLFCFAVWDIFYYVFLYLLIGWPATLLDWDILFLLPVPWIGPVLAPCLLSLMMILMMLMVTWLQENQRMVKFSRVDLILLVSGSLVVIGSFTRDYFMMIAATDASTTGSGMMDILRNFIPESFSWLLFGSGVLLLMTDFVLIFLRSMNKMKPS